MIIMVERRGPFGENQLLASLDVVPSIDVTIVLKHVLSGTVSMDVILPLRIQTRSSTSLLLLVVVR
jgi:hypothetical protein